MNVDHHDVLNDQKYAVPISTFRLENSHLRVAKTGWDQEDEGLFLGVLQKLVILKRALKSMPILVNAVAPTVAGELLQRYDVSVVLIGEWPNVINHVINSWGIISPIE